MTYQQYNNMNSSRTSDYSINPNSLPYNVGNSTIGNTSNINSNNNRDSIGNNNNNNNNNNNVGVPQLYSVMRPIGDELDNDRGIYWPETGEPRANRENNLKSQPQPQFHDSTRFHTLPPRQNVYSIHNSEPDYEHIQYTLKRNHQLKNVSLNGVNLINTSNTSSANTTNTGSSRINNKIDYNTSLNINNNTNYKTNYYTNTSSNTNTDSSGQQNNTNTTLSEAIADELERRLLYLNLNSKYMY
jgi:hypothetical protein